MRDRLSRAARSTGPLALLLAAAIVGYAPALTSPFWLDDYFYLVAARDLSTVDYFRAAFTPWGNEPLLPFTHDFWRPLAFLWFELLEPLAGGNPLPYHLVVLGGHLAAVAFVWVLAAKLDPRRPVRLVAAAIVAVYPGTYQAVAWISSVNSLALPLALGAWVAFLRGTENGALRWRPVSLSVLMLALAAMHREGAWVVLPVLSGWHVAQTSGWRLRDRRTWLPLLPFGGLVALYVLVRTRGFSEPLSNREVFDWGSHVWPNYRTYLELLLFPFSERLEGITGWRATLQQLSVPVVPLLTLGCVILRRWSAAILLFGALLSLFAVAPNQLGVGPRYLYFTIPWLALGLAILTADLVRFLPERSRLAAPALAVALLVAAGAWSLNARVADWNEWGPGAEQTWVENLRATYPSLPPGAQVYAAGNVPGWLTVFGGVNLDPVVRWYYPTAAGATYLPPGESAELGPGDVLFVAP